jgi:hypothetical protein
VIAMIDPGLFEYTGGAHVGRYVASRVRSAEDREPVKSGCVDVVRVNTLSGISISARLPVGQRLISQAWYGKPIRRRKSRNRGSL